MQRLFVVAVALAACLIATDISARGRVRLLRAASGSTAAADLLRGPTAVAVPSLVAGMAPAGFGALQPVSCPNNLQQIREYERVLLEAGALIDAVSVRRPPSVVWESGTFNFDVRHPVAQRAVDMAIRFFNDHRPGETGADVERATNTVLFPELRRIAELDSSDFLNIGEATVAANVLGYAAAMRAYQAACVDVGRVRPGAAVEPVVPERGGGGGTATRGTVPSGAPSPGVEGSRPAGGALTCRPR